MNITILTLFPDVLQPLFSSSIIGRAQKKNLVTIRLVNLRDFATDKHRSVDDRPYGGGVGMILRFDVIAHALRSILRTCRKEKKRVILLDPKGETFSQEVATRLTSYEHLILLCGHYEGVDNRVHTLVEESISIGNYILSGGEIPAMVVTDAVVRLIPHVLSKSQATAYESFSKHFFHEPPHYTRPAVFEGRKVPSVLLSGNPKKIEEWKQQWIKRNSPKKDF